MARTGLIYVVPHLHCSPVGREDQRTCAAQAFDVIACYLEAARRDSSFKFVLSHLDCLKPYWDLYADQRSLLRELIGEGRLEVSGGYSLPSETSIQGEALLRNLIYGRAFHQGVLGSAPCAYLALEALDHCPQLPQILRQLGFTACISHTDFADAPPLCRALAPDDSELICLRAPNCPYPQSQQELLDELGISGERQDVQPDLPDLDIGLLFIGRDMQPPPEWFLGRQVPQLQVGLPLEYLEALERRLAQRGIALPPSSRELAMHHPGTTVSRIELKIANRLAENALLCAERFCSIAWLLGAEYPHLALDKAWRLLMFGHHPHAITGNCCDLSFLDLMAMYREALELAQQVKGEAVEALASLVDTMPARGEALSALVIFNPLPWARTDVCWARLRFDPPVQGFAVREAGRTDIPCQLLWQQQEGDAVAEAEIAFVASEVPALGYVVYHVVADAQSPPMAERCETDRGVIENEYYSIAAAAQAGGGLVSVIDRQTRRQILDLSRGQPGNDIAAVREREDRPQPARSIVTTGERIFATDEPARVWVERGPVIQRIVVEGKAPDCAGRRHETCLYPGVRRVDFTTELRGYRGQHQLFAATFPLALCGGLPVFEERFGAVVRSRSIGNLDYRTSPDSSIPSIPGCALLPAQNWMECGSCLRVTAHKAKDRAEACFSVGPAAIITGTGADSRRAGERLVRILAARGISASAFTDDVSLDADPLHTTFRFSLSLGDDNSHARRLLAAAPPDVREQAAKAAQRPGCALVLLLERAGNDDTRESPAGSGCRRDVPALLLIARDAEAAAAALDQLEKDAADGVISLSSRANAVDEEQPPADDYGVALFNLGNIGAGIEADGTAVLALMHTAAWPGLAWGEGKLASFFVPEHKDHRFRYALYAHRGDWRAACTARHAHEFNQPLIAVARAPAKGELPPRHSFFALAPDNVYLSALKPHGYPLAMGMERSQGDQDPLIARIYEGHGDKARAELTTPFALTGAWRCDPAERRGAQVRVAGGQVVLEIEPCKIETVELAVRRQALLAGVRFGPRCELVQPCHMRYWEHNLGPAPMGNQPLTVTMRGAPSVGATTRFTLRLANSMADTQAVGMVRMLVPEGWTITPTQVPYRIAPGDTQDYEVTVIVPAAAEPAYIRAEVEFNGQVYQEVLPVGDIEPVIAAARQGEEKIEVVLRNANADRMHGRVDLVTPLEAWGAVVGELARGEVRPAAQGFELAPGAECVLAFEVVPAERAEPAPEQPDLWAYARIACHGHVQYLKVL